MKNQYNSDLSIKFHIQTKEDLESEDKRKLNQEIIQRAGMVNIMDGNILDIGCAGGVHINYILEQFPNLKRAVGIDLSESLIKIAKEEVKDPRAEFILSDMDHLPFDNEIFDFVFSRNTLHYSEDISKTYRSINNVMKKNAYFYFQVTHPAFTTFIKSSKDYGLKENVSFPIQGGAENVVHPSFTISEYVNNAIKNGFKLLSLNEHFGRRSIIEGYKVPTILAIKLEKIS